MSTKWYHWLISVVVCISGIMAVSVDIPPEMQTILVAISAFILGIMKTKLPTLPPVVVDILTVGITTLIRYFKKKNRPPQYCLLFLLFVPLLLFGCSVNLYAEKMSKIAVQDCQSLFLDRLPGMVPKPFTQNEIELYLTGFMRANKVSQADSLEIIKQLRENGYKVNKNIQNILMNYGIELLPE